MSLRHVHRAVLLGTIAIAAAASLQIGVAGQQNVPEKVLAYADLVFHSGKVLTVDKDFTIAEAIAVRDGKVLAVGRTEASTVPLLRERPTRDGEATAYVCEQFACRNPVTEPHTALSDDHSAMFHAVCTRATAK